MIGCGKALQGFRKGGKTCATQQNQLRWRLLAEMTNALHRSVADAIHRANHRIGTAQHRGQAAEPCLDPTIVVDERPAVLLCKCTVVSTQANPSADVEQATILTR